MENKIYKRLTKKERELIAKNQFEDKDERRER